MNQAIINNVRPELLSPAGDMQRLLSALDYGADAVYLAGTSFGMRAAPANFTEDELRQAVELCHARGVKTYVTCNTLPRNRDFEGLPQFLEHCAAIGVDAFIIIDLGVLNLAKRHAPNVAVHISTQSGVVNYEAARALHELGASRVVLARELPLDEIAELRAKTPSTLEIEAFVHGAMCVSVSGRCLLSNYMAGRDANCGNCAQPCRWDYWLVERTRPDEPLTLHQEQGTAYILNSRDLCMAGHIRELFDAGVTSLKIEGRAKSEYYTACVTNAYRHAVDAAVNGKEPPDWVFEELEKISHRPYSTGFYLGGEPGQETAKGGYVRHWDVGAICTGEANGLLRLSQRNRFFKGETMSVLEPGSEPFSITLEELYNESMEPIEAAPHATMTAFAKVNRPVKPGAFLRIFRG